MESLHREGFTSMPQVGPWSVTVPGAVGGWQALLERFGTYTAADVLRPARDLARNGFDITPVVAKEWAASSAKLKGDDAASRIFLQDGRPPMAGERWRNSVYADLLTRLMDDGLETFYEHEIASSIADAVAKRGGPMRVDDLLGWHGTEWVEPVSVPFGQYELHELPPPGQGLVAMVAMSIYALRPAVRPADAAHVAIEAIKEGFADAQRYVSDPRFTDVPLEHLLAPERIAELRDDIEQRAPRSLHIGPPTDTVYLAVADKHGGACSLIQSVYDGFGSAVGVPELGIVLQNRAGCFELMLGHANAPEPGKRPYHTIIPAMLSREENLAGCLGVVGGFMQPQGHLQVLRNLVEEGMTPQEAVDAPRFRVMSNRVVDFEPGTDPELLSDLEARGHRLGQLDEFQAGGAQLLLVSDGEVTVGSDRRKDGHVR